MRDHLILNLEIKPDPELLQRLFEIEQSAHASPWTYDGIKESFNPYTQVSTITEKGVIVGFAVMALIAGEAELYTIGVAKSVQDQGLGQKLLRFALDEVRKAGAQCCYLEVAVSNLRARHVYEKSGFKLMGKRPNYYDLPDGRHEDALTMVLQF